MVGASEVLVVVAGNKKEPLTVARGATHGSFHPVAGTFVRDDTQLEECGRDDTRCLQQALGNIALDDGPSAALERFDELLASGVTTARSCHPIAHGIGSAALARYHGDVAKAFSRGSSTCASGYYHGLLERAFVGASTKGELARRARRLCASLRARGFLAYQCVHGLGHGLMIQTGYDLPIALEMCDRLATGWDVTSCRGGAFMENTSTDFGFRSRWLKDDDLIYPCNAVNEEYRKSCYLRVTTRILNETNFDWAQAATLCRESGARWSGFCFRSFGRDASGFAEYDPAQILALCGATGEDAGECVYGAARAIADAHGDPGRARPLCSVTPEEQRDPCFAGAGLVVGLLNATDRARRAACLDLAAAHAPACIDAARAEVAVSGRGAWG